jgi:uracil-DNA glycosylase
LWDQGPGGQIEEDPAAREERIKAAVVCIEEMAELHPAWSSIALGGPVEPYFPPRDEWNGILLVGKAPGEAEVAHAEPFTGRSGRLTTRLLAHAGIHRDACLITNVFRMQAPWSVDSDGRRNNDDVSHFFTDDPRRANDRLPALNGRWCLIGPDEHVRDLWRLVRSHRPWVVVALGSIAAWALTRDGTLKDRTGQPLDNDVSSAPVVITRHPAYALRKKDEGIASAIAQDLAVAREIIERH